MSALQGILMLLSRKRTGNYMVFFPSYKMMNDVADIYCEKLCRRNRAYAAEKLICQRLKGRNFWTGLSEESDRTLVAFGIMGGIFGEGIDLKKRQTYRCYCCRNGTSADQQ